MKPVRTSVLLLSLVALTPCRAEPAPAADPVLPVVAPIVEVTVFADRARVIRQGTADLTGQPQRVRFASLPSWLDESSVRVRLVPAAVGEVLDVVIETTYLAQAEDAAVRAAEAALREIQDRVQVLEDRKRILAMETQQIEAIRVFSMDKFPKDAAVRAVQVDEYRSVVDFLTERHTALAETRRALERDQRELAPELQVRQKRLQEIQQRAALEQKHVVALVRAAAAGPAVLLLEYQLPGTTWQPRHEARVVGREGQVSLYSYAAVTQTTGEDWTDVALTFSTRSPDEAMTIPQLQSMLVGREVSVVAQRSSLSKGSWDSANGRFMVHNAIVFNLDNQDPREQQAYLDNRTVQVAVQEKVQTQFEKIRKRGTTALFLSQGQTTVRADGREVRVPVGRVDAQAELSTVAVPSMSLNAVNTAIVRNGGEQPMLPGPIALFRDGDFLGSTEVEFVAPGETFGLFLGLADEIKVSRTLDRRQSSANWTGARRRMRVLFSIDLENLGAQPRTIVLKDQVPVSENRDIRVTDILLDPRAKPDEQGLVNWKIELAAGAKRQVQVGYTLDYPRDYLVQRAAQARQEDDAGLNQPAAARLDHQIMELEKNF